MRNVSFEYHYYSFHFFYPIEAEVEDDFFPGHVQISLLQL